MAFSNIFSGKSSSKTILKTKIFTVTNEVVGQGAFGIVYKGSDTKKNLTAAKRIDGSKHPRILTQNFSRLLQLDHPNIMKIFDIQRKGDIVWMFMPFCVAGDLNKFYYSREVELGTSLEIMIQIISGIDYLHTYNIVHRDIKPGNILVASDSPVSILLTDFDVIKCLDPEVETSLMSSNVGTLAFKAPEFFQRTEPGKIEYHSNVDIYSSALTFLAILQAKKEKRMLIPQIETPQHDSEYHAPSIGQLISERIKYKVVELNIVVTNDVAGNLHEIKENMIKELIKQMSCVKPEERLSAGQVLESLQEIYGVQTLKPQSTNVTKPVLLDRKVTNKIKQVNTARTHTWNIASEGGVSMDLMNRDLLVASVELDGKRSLKITNRVSGSFIGEIPSGCDHKCSIGEHPVGPNFVLENCPTCKEIRRYDTDSGEYKVVYKGYITGTMCTRPNGSLLVVEDKNNKRYLSQLKWDYGNDNFQIVNSTEIYRSVYHGSMKIGSGENIDSHTVIFSIRHQDYAKCLIQAVKLENPNSPLWRFTVSMDIHTLESTPVACDESGLVFICDEVNNRVVMVDSLTGEPLRIFPLEKGLGRVYAIRWSPNEPKLTLFHGQNDSSVISCYSLIR